MNKTIKKIGLILILSIILPMMFFLAYELNSLGERENILREIYNRQIDAILFSLNQYADDAVSAFAVRISKLADDDDTNLRLREMLNENKFISKIIITDSLSGFKLLNYAGQDSDSAALSSDLYHFLLKDGDKISKIYLYAGQGYYKTEPLTEKSNSRNFSLAVIISYKSDGKALCIISFSTFAFLREVLEPKLRSIPQEDFRLAVFNKNTGHTLFPDENIISEEMQVRRDFWIFPELQLGISMKGKTIEELVKERSFSGFILIIGISFILLVGVYFIFRNIRKEIELAQIKSDFVSNVSHELRTPLALINLFAETLEMERISAEEKKKEYYTIISQESARLSGIVNRILNFSQLEAGKRKFNFKNIDLNTVASSMFRTYNYHLGNKGFEFEIKIDSEIPQVKGDFEAISECVINLLDNAVKYSSENKKIVIKTGTEKEYSYIEVEDNGVGIPEDQQKKIFEKFYRVTTGSIHNVKGTGLGLSIVKQIIEAHNGRITVNSTTGNGSRFRILLRRV